MTSEESDGRFAWLSHAANAVVIAGVAFFFVQEFLERKRQRVASSVEYGRLLHSGDYADARSALVAPWLRRRDQMLSLYTRRQNLQGEPIPPTWSELKELLLDVIDVQSDEASEIILALYRIEGLMIALGNCVEEGVCDDDTANKVMMGDATELYCFFGMGFQTVERTYGLSNFGEGITAYADRDKCPHVEESGEKNG